MTRPDGPVIISLFEVVGGVWYATNKSDNHLPLSLLLSTSLLAAVCDIFSLMHKSGWLLLK